MPNAMRSFFQQRSARSIVRNVLMLLLALIACCDIADAESGPYPWEKHLRGDAVVLLGETHDNAIQHQQRLEVLRRAFAAGWRPAIAMEQFDREQQMNIDRARKDHPLDVSYLIANAMTGLGNPGAGWNWEYYRPYVALALQYDVPLIAANLSRSDAQKIVEHGYSAIFDDDTIHSLGLDRVREAIMSAQAREIDIGHCRALPKEPLPAMARAQLARDAIMAATLREHASNGLLLLAGNGHIRRDIGVATWLDAATLARVFTVGFLEQGDKEQARTAFDAIVITKRAARPDPCAALRRSLNHRP